MSGLPPGSVACTEMVGKSTCGSGETGSRPKAKPPASAIPMVSSVVATGRRMKRAGEVVVHGASVASAIPEAAEAPRRAPIRSKKR